MTTQYDSLFEGIGEPVSDTGSPTNLQYQSPRNVPISGASQYDSLFEGIGDEPIEKKEGIFAWGQKGWADMLDYVTITFQAPAAFGAGDFDEELVAESIADINQRAREYVKSEGHKRIMAMMQREGKDFAEAEGFWETSKETLEWVGNAVLGMVTDPQGMAEFTAGQVGMQAPGLAGMFVGWISPIPGGAYAGMAAGELAVETGAGVFEAMHHRGIDTTDKKAVLDALFDTDILEELYKEGLVKGSTIAAFGMLGVGAQKFILTAAGRELSKKLIKAGVTKPLNKGGFAEAKLLEASGNTAVIAAFKQFANATTKTRYVGRAAGATTVELLSEMGGEAFGQKLAWGEIDPVEVGLEGLGALGQSIVQTAVVKGLTGTKELATRTLLKRAQRNALEKGEDSGITPAAINEDLQRRANAVRDRMVDIDAEMSDWEEVLSGADSNSSLTVLADLVASLGGIEKYQSTLRTILQEELGTDFVPIWTALTKEEQATIAAGGTLDHAVRGSLNKGLVKPKGTEEVVAVRMPVASVIARGNWDALELVSSSFGIELVTAPPVEATETVEVVEPTPLTEAQVAEREAVLTEEDIKLDREREIGGLEEEAKTRSEKDVDVDVNNVVVDTQNKLRQVKESSEYENEDLAGVVERLKLTPRGKTVSARREIITAYRKALENPSNVSAINSALINTGYKVTASKGVVKIVPIDSKNTRYKPLRVAETGSRKVGQDSIDDYIFWINEGQVTKTKRPSIRKSPLKGRTIITPQATGALTSLQAVFKRKGKGQFVERVRKLLSNKKGNDAILEQIAKVYRKSKPGRAEGDVASVLTLAGKSDQADIAKAYALLSMLITLQDSVSSILPDNTLSIEDKNVKLLARIELKTPIRGVRENQLINQIKDVFGEDSTYTRISDFEVAIGSPSLKPLQIARRLGRLKVKRNDIRNSGLFTAKTETHTHNWSEDPSGESIREQIRSLGFGDLLAWADDRRADYLNLAEEVGAKEVAEYRVAPRAPPAETAPPTETELPSWFEDDVELSLGPATAEQRHTSEDTSLRQIAALLKRKILFNKGERNLDIGGGKYDLGTEQLQKSGVDSRVVDRFNRDDAHNRSVESWVNAEPVDTVTVANVLNVIEEDSSRREVLEQAYEAVKPGGKVYIQVYEGDRKGEGRITKRTLRDDVDGKEKEVTSWQNHRALKSYLPEVQSVFDVAEIESVNGLRIIVATKSFSDAQVRKLGLPGVDRTHGVGKRIGGKLYVHKSAEDAIAEEMGKAEFNRAKSKLPGGFEYDVVIYNPKNGSVDFVSSPDWDTASEPVRGVAYKVGGDGSVERSNPGKRTPIYHHKWSMVRADYKGFDLAESHARTIALGTILPDLKKGISSTYGWQDVWENDVVPALDRQLGKKVSLSERMERWLEIQVNPIVANLEEDARNIKFNLPSDLSNAQKSKYKTAVGRFFVKNKVRLEGDTIIASFPLPVSEQPARGRGRRVSSIRLLTGRERFTILGSGRNGKIRKVDVGTFLQERTRALGRIAVGDYSPEAKSLMVATVLEEVRYQLGQSDSAIGWYEEKVSNMMAVLGTLYPELNTDPNAEMVMKAFLAITSQGQEVDENLKNAVAQYEHYRETGKIRIWGTGKSIKAMKDSHEMLANLIEKWGIDNVREFLERPYTVKQLKDAGFEVAGELTSYSGRGALIFGPKIGSFYGNLYGHYESLTADLWFSRTWNRITGNLLESSNRAKLSETTDELMALLRNARVIREHLSGYRRQDLLSDESIRLEWAASVHSAWARGGYKNKTDTLRVIKRYDEVHNQLVDAPRSGEERGFMRSVIWDVQDALKEEGFDISVADIQALLWYGEKDLYATLGVADSRSEATDYEQAARRLFAEKHPDLGFDYVLRGGRARDREGSRTQREDGTQRQPRGTTEDQERPRVVESLAPLEQPASGGLSALGLRRVLVKRFGKAGIAMLEAEGILKIVESATDLPAGLIKDEDAAMRARGLYYSKTGTAYLVANRLTASTAPKVLLHEVGTHFGLKRMLGSKAYATLILDLVAGKETTFAPWFERVRRNYKGRLNENTDRFAEEVLAHIAEDTSEVTLSIRDGIWRAVRLFLNRYFGLKLPKNLSAKEIGYVIQGSLRLAMRGRPRYMVVGTDEVMLGGRRIFFPDYAPTRTLTDAHRRYAIASAIDRVIPPSEESRLRRNMDGMMKVAERVGKKGYPDIDIHLPVVVVGDAITSRYALFKNTKTGTELVIRMSDHPKTIYDAAGAYPFISFNNGHKIDSVDLSDIDRAVKLLSQGKLEGMNGLEFQFEYGLGDGVQGVSKPSMQKVSYNDYKRILGKRSPSKLARIQNLETVELTIGPIVDEEGPVFSIAPEGGRTEEQRQAVRRTLGAESNASVGEWVNDARHRWIEKFIQGAVDAYRPVRNLLGEGAERAWQMMHLSENVNSMLMTALNFGKPKAVYKNGKFDWYSVDWEGEGLIDTLKGLNGETNDFMAWMTYVRAKKLMAEGREKNFTEDEIKTGLTLNQGEMADGRSRKLAYAQAMQKMSKYQSAMLDMAVEAGVISKAVREELEVDFYVPFYREFMPDDKTGMRGPTPVHDFVNIKDVIHKLRGSELSTHDVLHNVLMNWTALMSASMKNRAGQAAMDAAVKAGVARIVTDKKEAAQLGFSKGKVRGEKLNRFVYVLKDGERVWYEVNDPLVLNSMVQMAWGGVDGKLIRTLSTFKRWLTLGVTASPYFKIRNMIRDTVHSIAVGKLKYNMFGNAAKGYDALKNDELISAEMMMGGATFHFGFYYDDPASLRMMLDAGISESRILNTPAKIRKGLRPFWKWYADMGNRMENANRASLYMQRKEEVGHLAASFEARDLMNFSSHGRWVAVQWLTSSLPFLNARLVGMEKLVRAGEAGTRARMLTVVSTVVLASILLRMSYEDDEDYEKLPEWQKNTYWAIKIPGTKDFFFLPKPFEIGAIASVGERITENFVRDIGWAGNPTRNYTFQQIGEIISDQLAVDWKPQIAKPVIELWRNKDTFTDRRIENISWQMQNTPRDRRVRPYTTELAIRSSWAMGELLDMFHAKDTDIHLSPVQIDHLIKGYFGWLGAFTTSSFDILSSDVEPTKHVTDMLGSFYLRNPKGNDKYLALFYEQALEVAKYKSAYDSYKRDRMVEQALQVVEEHGDVLRWEKAYTKIREGIAKINRRIREIYDDSDMSPTDKDKELDKLRQLRVDIAKKTVLTRAQWEAARGIKPSHGSISLEAMGGGD